MISSPITESQLAQIITLDLGFKLPQNLTGLDRLASLETLNLSGLFLGLPSGLAALPASITNLSFAFSESPQNLYTWLGSGLMSNPDLLANVQHLALTRTNLDDAAAALPGINGFTFAPGLRTISASYNHATYFEERQVMMQDWADHLAQWRAAAHERP